MNKVMIGKGNLQKFAEDYEKVTQINKGNMWSVCYPTTSDLNNNQEEFKLTYEYVIGYVVYDEPTTQQQPPMEM